MSRNGIGAIAADSPPAADGRELLARHLAFTTAIPDLAAGLMRG